jgi:hypothetical protein
MGRVIFAVMMTLLFISACTPVAPDGSRKSVSLNAAEGLHERLIEACDKVGCVALYEGSLSYTRSRGLTPIFHAGRWKAIPWKKIPDPTQPADELLREEDVLFSLQVVPPSAGENRSVTLMVKGEAIGVIVEGRSGNWHLPGTTMSVLDLLRSCSDEAAYSRE